MSTGARRSVLTAALLSASIGWFTSDARAQPQEATPSTLDEAPAARAEKATAVQPHRRAFIERVIFKLEDDLLLERLLDAPRGLFVRVGQVGEGAGFALGPALRYNTAAFDFKTSAAVSMKKYFVGEALMRFPGTVGQEEYTRADGPYVEIYGRRRDFPQEDFFGLGPESELSDRSNYALRDTLGRGTGGFEYRALKAGVGVGYLEVATGAGADLRMPSSTDIFTAAEMPGVADRPAFVIAEPFIEITTRDRALEELAGGVYRLSLSRYRDQKLDRYSFLRWEADLRHYFTFVKDTRMIALRAWASAAEPDSGQQVPFFLQPTLGGARTLRGYRSFRFRDRSALLLQAEYRWRINELVTGALFYDTGSVAPSLGDLGRFERNFGVGLRAGVAMGAAFRMDLAFGGREGTRFLIRFDDAF